MDSPFHFTYANLKEQYHQALDHGYTFITCEEYSDFKRKEDKLPEKTIVNRIDIDLSVKKAEQLGGIFKELNIKGSFFIRLHAPEYNPFSFENYRIIKNLIFQGHEIGYHSEILDQSVIWGEKPIDCLRRDISVINNMYGINISGVASHGGMTGLNNLDFWKEYKPADFGLKYEAYDKEPEFGLFDDSFYISDSEWTQWKCYDKGRLVEGDNRTFSDHLNAEHPLIYLLIHSDTYFNRHFYE